VALVPCACAPCACPFLIPKTEIGSLWVGIQLRSKLVSCLDDGAPGRLTSTASQSIARCSEIIDAVQEQELSARGKQMQSSLNFIKQQAVSVPDGVLMYVSPLSAMPINTLKHEILPFRGRFRHLR
jgi:hypothetical protein